MFESQHNVKIISQVYGLVALFILFHSQASVKFFVPNTGKGTWSLLICKCQSPNT